MKTYLLLLLFIWSQEIICKSDDDLEKAEAKQKLIEQLTLAKTDLIQGYDLITRISATTVYPYRGYRSVAVMYYSMPEDTSTAVFNFQADNIHMNSIGHCGDVEVEIHIKHGSFPAVNPDGYNFPSKFIKELERAPIHSLELLTSIRNLSYVLENPEPGDWFAIVFQKWEDPRTQQVSQQGLSATCETVLYTDLQVKRDIFEVIDCNQNILIFNMDEQIVTKLKCKMTNNDRASLNISIHANANLIGGKAIIRIQAKSMPSILNNLVNCSLNLSTTDHTIYFEPKVNSWHYITLEYTNDTDERRECQTSADMFEDLNYTILDLVRESKNIFFSFEHDLPSETFLDSPNLINLTSSDLKTLKFDVTSLLDIGGTMVLAFTLLMNVKYYMGYKRKFEQNNSTLLMFSENDQFFKVVICADKDYISIPTSDGQCRHNAKFTPAILILNSTDSETINDKVLIPFPEAGTWYITMRLFCDESICPCMRSADNDSYYLVESNVKNQNKYQFNSDLVPNKRIGDGNCNTSVLFSISSMPCVMGRCSNHGRCLFTTAGGMVMSSCFCNNGYGGWDCADASRMDSYQEILVATLLLTLSNLMFIFSIYVAVIRKYYSEAIMYTFTMSFSTFYHACDVQDEFAFCIFSLNLLQFGDFFCGIMSFWVTLLAMSVINMKCHSIFQLTGAIMIAFLTTWNMHSLWAFMLPVCAGVAIVGISWVLELRRSRGYFYPKSYFQIFLPIGVVLVSIGLICFAFLQTEHNYKIVHSLWHMIIAGSIVCLLPDEKRTINPRNPFLPTPNQYYNPLKRMFCKG